MWLMPNILCSVETPINVSHALRTEVWYSVEGEDVEGQPLQGGGPGVLRMLRVDKEVIVPAASSSQSSLASRLTMT